MSTLSNYKKEAKKLFIISVKKDIKSWRANSDYYSPNYNNSYFRIDRLDFYNTLRVSNNSCNDEYVCLINWLLFLLILKLSIII